MTNAEIIQRHAPFANHELTAEDLAYRLNSLLRLCHTAADNDQPTAFSEGNGLCFGLKLAEKWAGELIEVIENLEKAAKKGSDS
ncbi:hypothetical protein [uncultured Sulfitobacter sp.]|uniref:hypothetical protein n=1 Tax=uncultured Sulfitobacter sp. TaxID=191468 RepID=UPI002617B6FA|nr:hypothetical protein [uncultured Sulfitobacter sp.]